MDSNLTQSRKVHNKPASIKEMALPLQRALEYRAKKARLILPVCIHREGIIGSGPAFEQAIDQLGQTIGSDASVLISGETGTGKEQFAQAVHRNSFRRSRNFVVVDCAALPETLVESILFGRAKGAFTSADAPREALVKQAEFSTVPLPLHAVDRNFSPATCPWSCAPRWPGATFTRED